MSLIKNRAIVNDSWRHVPDDEPAPSGSRVTVSLARSLAAAAAGGDLPAGVRILPEDAVETLSGVIDRLELVAVEFGSFAEGRGFSQARILREQLGYRGELRAVGVVTHDRVAFMARCGFDAFELRDAEDAEEVLGAFEELPLHYQPAVDGADIVARRRGWRDG